MSFFGYPRPDGSVGTRNYVLVIPQGLIAKSICDFVVGTRTIQTVDHGSGRTAKDRERIARVLTGLGRNPNVASVIVHAASPGVGYPELTAEEFLDIDLPDPAQSTYDIGEKKNQVAGTSVPPIDKSAPHVFLAQHTFWDLDGDGYEEPYIITIHKDTKKVVRIIARWEMDGVHRDEKDNIIRIGPLEYFTAFPFIPYPAG